MREQLQGDQPWQEITPVSGDSWRDRETVTVDEAAEILGISRNSAYNAIHTGQLPGMWVGKRFLVSVRRLAKRLDSGEAA